MKRIRVDVTAHRKLIERIAAKRREVELANRLGLLSKDRAERDYDRFATNVLVHIDDQNGTE